MKQGFVLFGLREKCGCTTNAIHIARYFAGGGYSVALIESAAIKSPSLKDYTEGDTVPYEKDGVAIYPTWDKEVPDADIIVFDLGAVSIAKILRMPRDNFEFILCANADEDTLFDLSESLTDEVRKLNLLVLLKECGDVWVAKFKALNYRTFKIGYSNTTCPPVLADNLVQICHFAGILPPDINYDLKEWVPAAKAGLPKKSLFSVRNRKKTTDNEKTEDIITEDDMPKPSLDEDGLRYDEDGLPIPEEIEFSGLKAHERDKDLVNKPEKVYASREEFEKEYAYKRVETSEKADVKDILKNTLDSAAGVSKSILMGITRFAGKVIPDKNPEENSDENEPGGFEAEEKEGHIGPERKKEENKSEDKEAGIKGLLGRIAKPINGSQADQDSGAETGKKAADIVLSGENTALTGTGSNIKEKEPRSKLKFIGHLTVFVTALKHGAGSSHVAGIIGSALSGPNNSVCFVHKKGTEYPNNKNMCEYTDTEFEEPYNMAKTIIFDLGCLGELTRNELVEMQRADIKVLVCGSGESDFQALARFIHKAGTAAGKWIYVFNLVPGRKKRNMIKDLMQEYDYIIVQMCDYDEVPKDIADMWNRQIKKKLK